MPEYLLVRLIILLDSFCVLEFGIVNTRAKNIETTNIYSDNFLK